MSSNKDLIQTFSEFRGIDTRSSDLTRPINAAKEAQNFIIEQNFSLGGEKGLHMFADYFDGEPIVGVHNYIYKDEDTGREQQELLVLGKELYRLKAGTFTINYTGSNTWGYDFYLDTTDSEMRFRLLDNFSIVLDYNVGTGLEDDATGTTKFSTLEAQIDAITNFTADSDATVDTIVAACFPMVSNTSIPSSTTSVDITVYYWEEVDSRGFSFDETAYGINGPYVSSHDDVNTKPPVFINKNNCCYIVLDGRMPLMKYDGSLYGAASLPGIIEEDAKIQAASNTPELVGDFRYYLRLVRLDAQGNYVYGAGFKTGVVSSSSGEAPEITVFTLSANSKGFAPITAIKSLGTDSTTSGSSNTVTLDATINDDELFDFYGHELLGPGDIIRFVQGSTAYIRRVTAVDRTTNTIAFDGDPVTLSAAGITIQWANIHRMAARYVITNSAQPNVSTITYSTYGAGVTVGSYLYFDEEEEWFKVTAIDTGSMTITIDGVVSIPSGSYYITDLALEIWRTENNGIDQFFLSQTKSGPLISGSIFDTTTDANLGEGLIIPDKEPDYLRSFPSTLCQHQGVMIVAGGKQRNGRLIFEDFQYIEGFPLATNFYDVPSNDAGIITALWPDTYDQLAVFKDTAYYSVTGSFRDEIPILNTDVNSENDLGVACQSAIVKVRERLNLGLGKTGFIAFANGQINYEFTKQLDADFLASNVGNVLDADTKLRVHKTQAINDTFKQQALFFVPAFDMDSTGLITQGANDNSKFYIIDYSENTWTERVFSDISGESGITNYPFYPTAGMAQYEDRLILASCAYDSTVGNGDHTDYNSYIFRRKEREVSLGGNFSYDYTDMHTSIPYRYDTGWITLEPIEDGLFHWLKIYSFSNTDYVSFDLRIRTYIDWDASTAPIDDTTISFTSGTKKHLFKLKATRAEALQIRFDTNAVLQKPTISGFEILVGDVDGNLEGVR